MDIKKPHELYKRIGFSLLILIIYLMGRSILLYGVSSDMGPTAGTIQSIVATMLSGDHYQRTIMALGIMPYINASLLVQVISSLKNANSRTKISKQKQDRWMLITAIIFTIFMALMQSANLTYQSSAGPAFWVRLFVTIELMGGAMVTYFLCKTNEKHGIGASMPIILLNVLTALATNMNIYHFYSYPILAMISVAIMVGTLYLENSFIKVPLQRVSIHNIHADQNYIAYKRNPVGIMPVMFATSVFIILRYFIRFLTYLLPTSQVLAHLRQNMLMTKPLGIGIYLIIIFTLSIVFSFIMLNPAESARQLQHNGDSIIGIYAGEKTKQYLVKIVLKWSIISGLIQAGCMSITLILAMHHAIPTPLALIPSSGMILVSIICSLVQEIENYYRYDAYRFFM